MDEQLNYLRLYMERLKVTSKLNILVRHSGQFLAGVISTIVKVLILTAIVCHLGDPFPVVFEKNN